MIQTAGKIIRHAGRIILKLALDTKRLELFEGIRRKCFEMSLCPVMGRNKDKLIEDIGKRRDRYV